MERMNIKPIAVIAVTLVLFLTMSSVSSQAAMMGPYPDYPTYIKAFKDLATSYPQLVSYGTIGKTVLNQDILMFRIGNPSGGIVLFDGALHGWEAEGSQLLYYYAKWLLTSSDPLAQRILAKTCTLIIPVVNVDSYFTNRTNAHGVDLNRNFATNWGYSGSSDPNSITYKGPSALSEPESKALSQIFQTRRPDAYVNLHAGGGEVIYASSYTDRTYLTSVASKMNALSAQRGVAAYDQTVIGGSGESLSDAAKAGARTSFLMELGDGERTLTEVSTQVLPRFIPIAVVVSQEAEGKTSSILFADGFESGNFNNWDGSQSTTGETLTTTNILAREGKRGASFKANGDQASEEAVYVYENIPESTNVFARGYLITTSFSETGSYSRFYFASIVASGNNVAMAGCRKDGNTIWWRLAVMNASSWVIVDKQASGLIGQWHRFELQWTQSSTNGYAKFYVDDRLICSVSAINTTAYGTANSVEFGIPQSGYAKTQVYLDSIQVSKVSLGSLPIPEDLNHDGKVDIYDAMIFTKAFGSIPTSPNWNPITDLDANREVDIFDASIIAANYGH